MSFDSQTEKVHVRIETKTEDAVFVQMVLAVHYRVLPDDIDGAFWSRNEASQQIAAAIFDAVDARTSATKLEDVVEKRIQFADIVKADLAPVMLGFRCRILDALVTDIRMRGWRDRWASSGLFAAARLPALSALPPAPAALLGSNK